MPCTTRWQRRHDDESGKPVSTKNFAQHKRLFHSVVLLTTEKCCHYRIADAIDEKTLEIIPRFHSMLAGAGTRTIRLSLHQQRKRKKIFMKYLPLKWRRRYLLFCSLAFFFFVTVHFEFHCCRLFPHWIFIGEWMPLKSGQSFEFWVARENGVVMIASGEQ